MRVFVFASLLAAAAPAAAADYLTEIPGQVFTTPGDAAAIAARARTCAAQQLAAGAAGGQVIVADDGRTLVANNALSYDAGLVRWPLRSRVTIEARDGRFRVAHAQIQRFNDQGGGWDLVGRWPGSGAGAAAAALQHVTADLAACIAAPPKAAEAW